MVALHEAAARYDDREIRETCRELGMPVDEEGLKQARRTAVIVGLTQEQFDAALNMHAYRMKFLFSPKSYDWRTRLALAWHFLFNPKGW